jgi:RND family efflux transporter MFP subunit
MYASVMTSTNDAYAKANDAVRTQISPFFSNAENTSIQLNFNTSDTQSATNAKTERVAAGSVLNSWQSALAPTASSSADTLLQNSLAALTSIHQLLADTSGALNNATNLDATTLASYKAAMTTATNEVNTVTTSLNTLAQNISSQKLVVAQAQASLALKQAGATSSDIDGQRAQVEAAQASMESIQAKLANSVITAPIDGVVTQQDAKVGQVASPATPLISIISTGSLEVDTLVPETDIGKITVSDTVSMTFDAFTGETFLGKVFYIDPAQTVTQGVVDYKVKVSFNTPDPRMKSGLTANLDIKTKEDDNVLILPQYAVIQNDQGSFVQILSGSVATNTPVTLGIQDQNGNVEILSGVTAGEQVINIGLKQ